MPRLTGDMEQQTIRAGFGFTATRIDKLGATNYTLVTIGVDVSGSVYGFEAQLRDAIIAAVEACRKNPRAENIMVRVLLISTMYPKGVEEIHGFKLLADIDTAAYPAIVPGGGTPLNDGVYSSIGATNVYAEQLADQDFGVNGIFFTITDGAENSSTATMKMVKEEFVKARTGEKLESLISILVGINAQYCTAELQTFQQKTGMDHYIDVGDATPRKLAKLAAFVSQSISSQSQALGTGGPSQNIAATI